MVGREDDVDALKPVGEARPELEEQLEGVIHNPKEDVERGQEQDQVQRGVRLVLPN